MFEKQSELFKLALTMIKTQYGGKPWSFGGGTALSACYWQHRNSTDIDIFLNEPTFNLSFFRPTPHNKILQDKIFPDLKRLKYRDFYFSSNYFELAFEDDSKIQFILASPLTSNPFEKREVFGHKNIIVETPNEIIAKKLFHRAQEFKPRDLIDIAIALKQNTDILFELLQDKALTLDMLDLYGEDLKKFSSYQRNIKAVEAEVSAINVEKPYIDIANNAFSIIREGILHTFERQISLDREKHMVPTKS